MFPEYILMSCIWAYTYWVRCVLVLHSGLAVVVWYPYAGWSTVGVTLWFGCGVVVSLCRLRHCWCYVVVWLWYCGICMQAEALLVVRCGLAVVVWYLYAGWSTVGVTLWFGCGGVVSVCRLKHCWRYVVVWLWWCGIRMQAEALLVLRCGMAVVVWYPYAGWSII